jgi:hypothetical protein
MAHRRSPLRFPLPRIARRYSALDPLCRARTIGPIGRMPKAFAPAPGTVGGAIQYRCWAAGLGGGPFSELVSGNHEALLSFKVPRRRIGPGSAHPGGRPTAARREYTDYMTCKGQQVFTQATYRKTLRPIGSHLSRAAWTRGPAGLNLPQHRRLLLTACGRN